MEAGQFAIVLGWMAENLFNRLRQSVLPPMSVPSVMGGRALGTLC